jgi:hypothetical protein
VIIEVWKCECGRTLERPWTTCFRCQPEARRVEADAFREQAREARILDVDRYSDGLIARTSEGIIVWVRDAGLTMRMCGTTSREDLVSTSMRLKDENRELLVENARLRRALERVTDKRSKE